MNVLPPTIGLPPSLEGLAGTPGERETVCARQLETACAREFETTRARQLDTARGQAIALRIRVDEVATR